MASRASQTRQVQTNVILHLLNDLPVVVDVEELPGGGDRNIRCTNVRTVDGKRPQWVHDRKSTFIFPMSMVRLVEAPPPDGHQAAEEFDSRDSMPASDEPMAALPAPATDDEELDEDLLARMRSV